MKAIVLTYDNNHSFTDHMIRKYNKLWPNHPFVFRIPYQNYPEKLKNKHGNNIELIPSKSPIKDTVLTLLNDLNDEEWIYWCIDDKYPVNVDSYKLNYIYNQIQSSNLSDISGLMFSFKRKIKRKENSYPNTYTTDISPGYNFLRRKNYSMIWIHQFLKVKVIKHLFQNLPDDIKAAKEMDSLIENINLPNEHILLALNKSIVEFGESTHRGMITKNCFESLKNMRMELPENVSITDKEIFMGSDKYEEPLLIWKIKNFIRSLKFRNG